MIALAPQRATGFAAVEYMFPYQFPKEQLVGALKAHRLTQQLHNLPAANWEGGDRSIAVQPDRKDEFREGLRARWSVPPLSRADASG